MKKEKRLLREKGAPYPLTVRLAAIGDYRLGVSRKEIALKYSITDPTVISHWIRKFEATKQSSSAIKPLREKKRGIKMTENESDLFKQIKALERVLKQKEAELKEKDKELKHEQMHRRAMEILIELADTHYHIDIRKNFGTKQ